FVMALRVSYAQDLGIDLRAMMALSHLVSRLTGLEPAVNKPILGKNAFRHESGIHVQGLLGKDLRAFEPFPPAWIGRAHEVAFGKHSGRSNVRHLCREYGMSLSAAQEHEALALIKTTAQRHRRELTKEEVLHALLKPWHRPLTA
ncbi:MAG: homoaconitate hydratase, partial [Candidatus Firestonebacteria bacterium]|nr:homoaconitate hydratase [Candidatus Firestonebacteria bacterium]